MKKNKNGNYKYAGNNNRNWFTISMVVLVVVSILTLAIMVVVGKITNEKNQQDEDEYYKNLLGSNVICEYDPYRVSKALKHEYNLIKNVEVQKLNIESSYKDEQFLYEVEYKLLKDEEPNAYTCTFKNETGGFPKVENFETFTGYDEFLLGCRKKVEDLLVSLGVCEKDSELIDKLYEVPFYWADFPEYTDPFSSPVAHYRNGKVYVNRASGIIIEHTFVHELIHWASHESNGGQNSDLGLLNECFTDIFTFMVTDGFIRDIENTTIYGAWLHTVSWLFEECTLEEIVDFYFFNKVDAINSKLDVVTVDEYAILLNNAYSPQVRDTLYLIISHAINK